MKPLPAGIFKCLSIAALILPACSCSQQKDCDYGQRSVASGIVSISGPAAATAGQQVLITVGVRNSPLLCSEEAEAWYDHIGTDTLRISGALRAAVKADPATCRNCRQDSVLYTLLYFTPAGKGTYHIITTGDTTATSVKGDGPAYSITIN